MQVWRHWRVGCGCLHQLTGDLVGPVALAEEGEISTCHAADLAMPSSIFLELVERGMRGVAWNSDSQPLRHLHFRAEFDGKSRVP